MNLFWSLSYKYFNLKLRQNLFDFCRKFFFIPKFCFPKFVLPPEKFAPQNVEPPKLLSLNLWPPESFVSIFFDPSKVLFQILLTPTKILSHKFVDHTKLLFQKNVNPRNCCPTFILTPWNFFKTNVDPQKSKIGLSVAIWIYNCLFLYIC